MRKLFNSKSLIGFCAGIFCVFLPSCKQEAQQAPEKEYMLQPVKVENKTLATRYSASIRGKQDIDIYPQVSGFLTKLCVEEGQKVRKGQILFVIDQVPYQAALQTAKANLAAAEASAKNAELTYESKKELHKQNVVSSFDLNTAENAMLAAQAQVAQMKALLLSASNNYSYTEVKSPSDGVVGTLPYRVGALVSPSMQQPLTTVSDNSNMYVYFSMNENQILDLMRKHGSKAETLNSMPEVELVLSDNSTYDEKGKIETISGVVDRSTGTVSIRAVFPNSNGLLLSGTSGNVVINTEKENCIVIPQNMTFEIQDKVYVYKVVDGVAKSFPIDVTRVDGGKEYVVNSGLSDGDAIIAEGVSMLREGTPIKVKQN